MPNRPQFSLLAVLVIIAVLAVPLAMIATHAAVPVFIAGLLLFPILGGSVGHLVGGKRLAGIGVLIGLLASVVFACVWPNLMWEIG